MTDRFNVFSLFLYLPLQRDAVATLLSSRVASFLCPLGLSGQ